MREATMSDALSLWRIQETLLQTYRTIFIGAETLFLSIAFLNIDKLFAVQSTSGTSQSGTVLIVVIMLGYLGLGGYVLRMWYQICRARAKDVSFVQAVVLSMEQGETIEGPFDLLKRFQANNHSVGLKVISNAQFKKNYRKLSEVSLTRRKMDSNLPGVFLVGWVLFIAVSVAALFS